MSETRVARPRSGTKGSGLATPALAWLLIVSCSLPDPVPVSRNISWRTQKAPEMAFTLEEIAPLFGVTGDGDAVLTISNERFREQYLSRPRRTSADFLEYHLRYDVHVTLTQADGEIIWQDTIRTEEEYSQDGSQLISHISGLDELRRRLVRQAAMRIMQRVRVAIGET